MNTVDRMNKELSEIVSDISKLTLSLAIKRLRQSDGFVIVAPDFYYDTLSSEQKNTQLDIKRRYDKWFERLQKLLSGAPKNVLYELKQADNSFRPWVEFSTIWGLTPNPETNIKKIEKDASLLNALIDILKSAEKTETILIPDTNSLLESADPTSYRQLAGNGPFTFLLMPTILRELDELKINHRNPEVRDKAKAIVTRIKGWRHQGSLSTGVIVDHDITVKTRSQEPQMANSLSWLDATVPDDRFIASALEAIVDHPNALISIVTGDINLQNKADNAGISIKELP